MKNMAAPATSMGLQEILTNPALQSSNVSSASKMHQSLDLTLQKKNTMREGIDILSALNLARSSEFTQGSAEKEAAAKNKYH